MTSDTTTQESEDSSECSEDWIPDQLGPEPFRQEVMDELISDPDEFLDKLWDAICFIEENIEGIPLPAGEDREPHIEAITQVIHEMGALLVIARTSYARACEGQDRFSMVVAKIFFRLGYLCSAMEIYGAPLSDEKRSDTLIGLAQIGIGVILQRRSAGQARVQAELKQKAGTKEAALEIATRMRTERQSVSQEDIAKEVKSVLGNVVPKEGSIIKWIQTWERIGALVKPPNRQ